MKARRIGVRVSAELHQLLAAAGDVSAATRALALLGAAAAGYELGGLRDEAASLLGAPLDAPVRAALRGLLSGRSTPVPQMLDIGSTPVPQMLDSGSTHVEPVFNILTKPPTPTDEDPLASVGIEV